MSRSKKSASSSSSPTATAAEYNGTLRSVQQFEAELSGIKDLQERTAARHHCSSLRQHLAALANERAKASSQGAGDKKGGARDAQQQEADGSAKAKKGKKKDASDDDDGGVRCFCGFRKLGEDTITCTGVKSPHEVPICRRCKGRHALQQPIPGFRVLKKGVQVKCKKCGHVETVGSNDDENDGTAKEKREALTCPTCGPDQRMSRDGTVAGRYRFDTVCSTCRECEP